MGAEYLILDGKTHRLVAEQLHDQGKIKPLAYSDQGGRPDGVQVMVSRNHLYVGHMFSDGFTVVDVRDPFFPRVVATASVPASARAAPTRSS